MMELSASELKNYLKRIKVKEKDLQSICSYEILKLIQESHHRNIPFENTQVLFSCERIPISTELNDIFNKLVRLGLRINHEWPSSRLKYDYAIFN